MNLKQLLKDISPPLLINLLSSIRRKLKGNPIWEGTFTSWSQASSKTSGYSDKRAAASTGPIKL